MTQKLQQMAAKAASWTPDAMIIAGSASISAGAWLMFPPAGYVVGGCFLIVGGVLMAKGR